MEELNYIPISSVQGVFLGGVVTFSAELVTFPAESVKFSADVVGFITLIR